MDLQALQCGVGRLLWCHGAPFASSGPGSASVPRYIADRTVPFLQAWRLTVSEAQLVSTRNGFSGCARIVSGRRRSADEGRIVLVLSSDVGRDTVYQASRLAGRPGVAILFHCDASAPVGLDDGDVAHLLGYCDGVLLAAAGRFRGLIESSSVAVLPFPAPDSAALPDRWTGAQEADAPEVRPLVVPASDDDRHLAAILEAIADLDQDRRARLGIDVSSRARLGYMRPDGATGPCRFVPPRAPADGDTVLVAGPHGATVAQALAAMRDRTRSLARCTTLAAASDGEGMPTLSAALEALAGRQRQPARQPAARCDGPAGEAAVAALRRLLDDTATAERRSAPACEEPPILVAGMHRSGTSLVSRLMKGLGVFLGMDSDHELSESLLFVAINDWCLGAAGARWDEPRSWTADAPGRHGAEDMARRTLHACFGANYLGSGNAAGTASVYGRWGWKDPRNTLLLRLWDRIFPGLRCVFVVRNATDTVDSLVRRHRDYLERFAGQPAGIVGAEDGVLGYINQTPVGATCATAEGANALQQAYLAEVERGAAELGDRALVVDFDRLARDPERQIERLAAFCGIEARTDVLQRLARSVDRSRSRSALPAPAGRSPGA